MATEAQVCANRSNAQKSTGPRTPEGKAIVAQNAVRHGLLAREVVIKGEDPEEFELYREGMLAELAPAGQMESLLAQRIAGLAWRLRRAERLQAAAFDTLPEEKKKWGWSDKDKKWIVPQKPQPRSEAERLEFGERIMRDFAQARILDRLLVYERRIEYSLYRSMAEMRKLRAEGRKEGQKVRRSAGQELSCETKPIGEVSSWKCEVASDRRQACETNPISEGLMASVP